MTVKCVFGKHIIEVNGTEEQVEKTLSRWAEEMRSTEPYMNMCKTIRERAVQLDLPGAKDKPILDILGFFLYEECAYTISMSLLRASRVFLDWLLKQHGMNIPDRTNLMLLISRIDDVLGDDHAQISNTAS